MTAQRIRQAVVAGQFYTGDASELKDEILGYLQQAEKVKIKGAVYGLVAPHAGYLYSGQTAAHAYKQVEKDVYCTVIVVAPSHQEYFTGVSIFNGSGYETPFGVMTVNRAMAEKLAAQDKRLVMGWRGHGREHSLEVQVPFLQVVLGQAELVPVVMGEQDWETCQALGKALAAVAQDTPTLLVASSDLSHFHPDRQARLLDGVVNEYLNRFDPQGLAQALAQGKCEACGGGPIVAVMMAALALGADRARVLHHVNSGDITGDRQGVVGYTAAMMYKDN